MIIYTREKKELIIPTGLGNMDNSIPFEEGYESGYTAGAAEGIQQGYDNGYDNGIQDGYDRGFAEGQDTGFAHGSEVGYSNGYNSGMTDGQQIGYQHGHNDGVESGYTHGYNEGEESGYQHGLDDQKARMVTLTAISNGHYEREDGWNEVNVDVQPKLQRIVKYPHWADLANGVAVYTPSSEYDGISEAVIDYTYVHNDGIHDGFASGYTSGCTDGYSSGYTSGYTDGVSFTSLKISTYDDNRTDFNWEGILYYSFDGRNEIIPSKDDYQSVYSAGTVYTYWTEGNTNFVVGVSGAYVTQMYVREIYIMFGSRNLYNEIQINPEDFHLTLNEWSPDITGFTIDYIGDIGEQYGDPIAKYGYLARFRFRNALNLKAAYENMVFSEGYDRGYTSGYDVGKDIGKYEQKALVTPLTITSDGRYTNENGYSPVKVSVLPLLYSKVDLTFNENTVISSNTITLYAGLDLGYMLFNSGQFDGKSLADMAADQTVIPAGTYHMKVYLRGAGYWFSNLAGTQGNPVFCWIGAGEINGYTSDPWYYTE